MVSVLSIYFQTKDVKIQKTVENFHSFVHTLLSEPAEREVFFEVRTYFSAILSQNLESSHIAFI